MNNEKSPFAYLFHESQKCRSQKRTLRVPSRRRLVIR
jgi:hypothetical protein